MKKKITDKTWFIILMCILFFPVGLYLLWKKDNFKKNTKIIITSVIAIMVVISIVTDDEDKPVEKPIASNNSQVETDEKDKPQEDIQEDAEKDIKEEPVEEEPTKEEEVSKLDSQDMLDDFGFKVTIDVASKYFIEEYEKQRIKKIVSKNVAVYSSKPVRDQAGTEFPYSFLVTGRYEEKGTGSLADFVMTLGFKNDQDLEDGMASCIQYINDDTGVNVNAMNPDDDVILQMLNILN